MLTLRLASSVAAALAASLWTAASAADFTRIVTGPERGTYVAIGNDLARLVAEPAGLRLEVMPSEGSTENVRRLRFERGVRLALVQSDVYQAFRAEADAGNQEAAELINPLRVVLPLYAEEIYFVVRADSPLTYIHEIRDKRINVGPLGSGTSLSATTVYRQMFGSPISEKNASFLSNEDALLKLATDHSIDVAVVVAGQPAKLFANMSSQAKSYVKLLKLDAGAVESKATAGTYVPGTVRSSSYPKWLAADVPTLTVRAMLVTYDFQKAKEREPLERFSMSLCKNFERLRSQGHAKWRDVTLEMPPLGKGWAYYEPSARILGACGGSAGTSAGVGAATLPSCAQSKQVLGLCGR